MGPQDPVLEELKRRATAPQTLKCVMANENALQFYAQVGFQIVKADADALPPNYTLRDTHTEQYVALVDLTKDTPLAD